MAVSPHRAPAGRSGGLSSPLPPLLRPFKAESFPPPGVRSLDSTALLACRLALAEAPAYPLPSGRARASSSALALGRVRWRHGHR